MTGRRVLITTSRTYSKSFVAGAGAIKKRWNLQLHKRLLNKLQTNRFLFANIAIGNYVQIPRLKRKKVMQIASMVFLIQVMRESKDEHTDKVHEKDEEVYITIYEE